jgi:hypothetical protein
MDVISTCPLGHTCEDARDGKLYRCRWYVLVQGKHPATDEIVDRWDCAIAWMPVLSVEVARTARGTQAAVESFRNNHNTLHSISHNFLAELSNRAQKRMGRHDEPSE